MKQTLLILVIVAFGVIFGIQQNMGPQQALAYVADKVEIGTVEVELLGEHNEYSTAYVDYPDYIRNDTLQEALEILEIQEQWVIVIRH